MINKLFKITSIILLSVISLSGCRDGEDNDMVKKGGDEEVALKNVKPIKTFFNLENVPTYKSDLFDPTQDFIYTTPSNNLKITIPANSIIGKNGQALPQKLKIFVREYFGLGDMLLSGVQTVSNNKMLVTGGSFFWGIEDENGNVDYMLNGNNVQAGMNLGTDLDRKYWDKMDYFKGEEVEQDGVATINWDIEKKSKMWVRQSDDRGIPVSFVINNLGLGWTNCDYLYKFLGDKTPTQFKVTLKSRKSNKIEGARVVMVSKSFPSVVNITKFDNGDYKTYEGSIAKGLEAKIIAIGENSKGELFIGDLDIKVKGDDTFEIILLPSTKEKVEKLLKKFNKK